MARESPTLLAAAAPALLALTAYGDPAADRRSTQGPTGQEAISPSDLGVGGIDG